MSDGICVDYSVFEIDGPIIAIIRSDTINDPIAPQLAQSIDGGNKGQLVPFFTDNDLADRFLRRASNPNLTAWTIPSKNILAIILADLKNNGYNNVIFDPEPHRPMRCCSIDEMLNECH